MAQPKNSPLKAKKNLLYVRELPEAILIHLLNLDDLELMCEAAQYRDDLTKPMIDKMIKKEHNPLDLFLLRNKELQEHSLPAYEYAVHQSLKRDNAEFLIEALDYYVYKQHTINLKLPINLLEHLANVSHQKGNLKLANLVWHIKDIPQYLAERITFDTLTNYKFVKSFKRNKEYYCLGKRTSFSVFVQQIRDYTTSLKSSKSAKHLLSRLW